MIYMRNLSAKMEQIKTSTFYSSRIVPKTLLYKAYTTIEGINVIKMIKIKNFILNRENMCV